MSTVIITPTRFEDVRTGESTFGALISDEYAETFIDTWDEVPEDDMEVLKLCLAEVNEELRNMMAHLEDNKVGCHIGPTYYDWDEIKHVWKTTAPN